MYILSNENNKLFLLKFKILCILCINNKKTLDVELFYD